MNIKERAVFTKRCLLVLKTAEADGDRKTVIVLDALANAHGIPAAYPARWKLAQQQSL